MGDYALRKTKKNAVLAIKRIPLIPELPQVVVGDGEPLSCLMQTFFDPKTADWVRMPVSPFSTNRRRFRYRVGYVWWEAGETGQCVVS